jgi:hypothetical protein
MIEQGNQCAVWTFTNQIDHLEARVHDVTPVLIPSALNIAEDGERKTWFCL